MPVEIRIPKLGMSMSEATLVEWLVADGEQVAAGTPLYSVETDKSVQDIDSPAAGMLKTVGTPGEIYPVGELIGTLD